MVPKKIIEAGVLGLIEKVDKKHNESFYKKRAKIFKPFHEAKKGLFGNTIILQEI